VARLSLKLFVIGLVAGACALTASTARAGGILGLGKVNCGPTSAVFSPFGDSNQYYLANDGGFEGGGSGWALAGGAHVVSGNEPYYLHSSADGSSLLIPSGGSAISPQICFGSNTPGIRFLVSSPTGSASVHVRIIARGLIGILAILDGGTIQVASGWSPTMDFGTTFSQLNSLLLGAKSIQLVITSANGSAQIDDVYIDPFLQW
jgi:hypothetical protein